MTIQDLPHPRIATREEWLAARETLLEHEKEATRHYDRVSAERRRLPMVKVEKSYLFDGPEGKRSLLDLFDGQRQLIVYHFMFDPAWEKGCMGCTGFVNDLGDLSELTVRNTNFVLISRAPLEKLQAYKERMGWERPWYSSFGTDFNSDYLVTTENGETHGLSVFFRIGDELFHTYSTYKRGCESLSDVYRLLDVTPYGRQEDWEDSPSGWPQRPTYG
ncbi:MAG: DUF899 domain-containing protein [Anaerolineae bacterium]|jgi:predicted dithiol-disulfide oxidoreductase (DUF899 family)|nr:DUF899 domain-containing protein [Anaerolineae bacterium]